LGIEWTFGDINPKAILKTDLSEFDPNQPYKPFAEFQHVFVVNKEIDLSKLQIQESEVADVKWVTYPEFLELIESDKFVQYSEEYKNSIKNLLEKEFAKNNEKVL